jgi:PhnB protein
MVRLQRLEDRSHVIIENSVFDQFALMVKSRLTLQFKKFIMVTINPYLNFRGNTEEAFNFYKSVFGGEFAMLQRFKDSPEASRVKESEQNMLMHISLPVGRNVLMGTDAIESTGHNITIGDNILLSVSTESKEETDKIFNGLSKDGKVQVPPSKMFWGSYFGMLTDKFGVTWMVSNDEK